MYASYDRIHPFVKVYHFPLFFAILSGKNPAVWASCADRAGYPDRTGYADRVGCADRTGYPDELAARTVMP